MVPAFMLVPSFGKLMEITGAAQSVAHFLVNLIGAKRATSVVILRCFNYGGISLFVVVFAMYPIALALYREANITRKLIPGAIALGSFTFTMTAIPATPQIQNIIPMDYFHTDPMAAPILGIVGALIMLVGGYMWLVWRERKFTAAGEGFTEPKGKEELLLDEDQLPNPYVSFLPLLSVILTLNLLDWHIVAALLSGVILSMVVNYKSFNKFTEAINGGAQGSMLAIINTSAAVGFGSVVRAVPGFQALADLMMGIGGSPLVADAVAVNVLAGATGSASGGMGIALEALGDKLYTLALETTAQRPSRLILLRRLDTLPHNGAVLTLLAVTGLTIRNPT